MSAFIRFVLSLCIYLSFCSTGQARGIDSLYTKEDVQKFLVDSLRNTEVIFAGGCADITRAIKFEMPVSREPDSMMVIDPLTGGEILVLLPPDTTYVTAPDTAVPVVTHPLDYVFKEMDTTSYHFYKKDIDGNGHTDLLVNTGAVFIVMDMDNSFKCYLFSVWNELSFQRFLRLPDGSIGVVFKHFHYPCEESASQHSKLVYVTDTIIEGTIVRIDTLYKIDTNRMERQRIPGTNSFKMVRSMYPDTLARLCRRTDTIAFRLHEFTTYNPKPKPASVSRILYQYVHSAGIGDRSACLEINKNGLCYLRYSQTDTVYSAMLDNKKLNDLWNFIAYADVRSKKNNYAWAVNHAEGGTFIIHFDDGTVKQIRFWACSPPLSLCALSRHLSAIKKDLSWQPQTPNGLECPGILLGTIEDYEYNNCCDSY